MAKHFVLVAIVKNTPWSLKMCKNLKPDNLTVVESF